MVSKTLRILLVLSFPLLLGVMIGYSIRPTNAAAPGEETGDVKFNDSFPLAIPTQERQSAELESEWQNGLVG